MCENDAIVGFQTLMMHPRPIQVKRVSRPAKFESLVSWFQIVWALGGLGDDGGVHA